MVLCVRTEKSKAEQARQALLKAGLLLPGYSPKREGESVFFAVSKVPRGFKPFRKPLEKKALRPRSLKEALQKKFSEKEISQLVSSFDVIGDIAVIEIPAFLEKKKGEIASALLEVHPSVRLVARKAGARTGVFRLRPLEAIAGKGGFETLHSEHGMRFRLDVEKAYFSPRLAAERQRVASLVKPGEKVLVLFAGVGPFAIAIAKKNSSASVSGIELNPVACKYFGENIRLNKTPNCRAFCGDVGKVVPEKFVGWADRVLMPLPKGGEDFLKQAFQAVKPSGAIHFYSFAPSGDLFSAALKKISDEAGKAGKKIEVVGKKAVLPHAPRMDQIVVDFRVF